MQKLRALISFVTLAVLATLALPVYAQVQPNVQLDQTPQINPLLGAPTVAITKVDLFKADHLSQVGIEWSVQKPTLTQITRFSLSLELGYQNGKSQNLTKLVNDGGARATSFTDLPGFPVASTKTILTTIYTTSGNITETEDFNLGSTAPPPLRPQPLDITQVTRLTLGCNANQDCFEVKWSTGTNVPSLQSFNSFNVKLDVTYSEGTTVSGSANASASERQKVIAVPKPHNGSPQTAKATINAAVTLTGSTTVVKETP
jgi:hypothetical protein